MVNLLLYYESKTLGIVVPEGKKNWHFASASFPCKSLVCHIFDMRIPWFWRKIWHGSISGNICLIEASNPAKFDALIKKRTILSLSSWTSMGTRLQTISTETKCRFQGLRKFYGKLVSFPRSCRNKNADQVSTNRKITISSMAEF